jgi:cadmium resistance protein CadD (predicted permease)
VQEFLIDLSVGIGTFSVTNIDDLLLLSFYFTSHKYRPHQIVSGQFVGIATLVLLSLVGTFMGKLIPAEYLRWLGFLPMLLGIKELINGLKKGSEKQEQEQLQEMNFNSSGVMGIAGVTIANGGDNLGVYTPLFAKSSYTSLFVYMFVFMGMTAVWCYTAYKFTNHEKIKSLFVKFGKLLFPFFLIGLGLVILFT